MVLFVDLDGYPRSGVGTRCLSLAGEDRLQPSPCGQVAATTVRSRQHPEAHPAVSPGFQTTPTSAGKREVLWKPHASPVLRPGGQL